jgi:hypothetical protein
VVGGAARVGAKAPNERPLPLLAPVGAGEEGSRRGEEAGENASRREGQGNGKETKCGGNVRTTWLAFAHNQLAWHTLEAAAHTLSGRTHSPLLNLCALSCAQKLRHGGNDELNCIREARIPSKISLPVAFCDGGGESLVGK